MEIIERGKLPSEEPITATCAYCKTKVRFLAGEAESAVTDPRDGTVVYTVTCPVCKRKI